MCDEKKRGWQKCDSKLKIKSVGYLTKRRKNRLNLSFYFDLFDLLDNFLVKQV